MSERITKKQNQNSLLVTRDVNTSSSGAVTGGKIIPKILQDMLSYDNSVEEMEAFPVPDGLRK